MNTQNLNNILEKRQKGNPAQFRSQTGVHIILKHTDCDTNLHTMIQIGYKTEK